MIPYGRQTINQKDIDAVVEVLRSDFLTQGPMVPAFEKAITEYCGVNYAVAVNSATSALHIACLALDVGIGDIVWTTPITFVASANCALYCGAGIDFVDIDPSTYNISVESLEKKLEAAKAAARLPKVVICVHMAGQSCDMSSIYALSIKYKFKVIEDASHAIGGRYQDKPIGSCLYSDITVFSFHPVKIITTGEGGIAMTKDKKLAALMMRFRSHGITRVLEEMDGTQDGPWEYQQISLGHNYRMTDIQAALGLSQIKRLDNFVAVRNNLAQSYNEILADCTIKLPLVAQPCLSSFHLYIIRLPKSEYNRKNVFENLRANGVGVNVHYIPVYRHPYFAKMGFDPENFPESENYYSEAITLPIYPDLTKEQQKKIASILVAPAGYQTLF